MRSTSPVPRSRLGRDRPGASTVCSQTGIAVPLLLSAGVIAGSGGTPIGRHSVLNVSSGGFSDTSISSCDQVAKMPLPMRVVQPLRTSRGADLSPSWQVYVRICIA